MNLMNGDATIVTNLTRTKLVSKDMLKFIFLAKFTIVHIARNNVLPGTLLEFISQNITRKTCLFKMFIVQ